MLETLQKASSNCSRKNQDRFKISAISASMMPESRDASERDAQACWTLMSRSERVLLVLLVLTVIILIVACLVIAYLFVTGQNVCESASCVKASIRLLEVADFAADPCKDFYEFICGNYEAVREDCEDEARLKKEAVVGALLEEDSSQLLAVPKQFHQVCINVGTEETNSSDTLLSMLSQIGGWPLLLGQEWNENHFHWLNFMVELRSKGFRYDWFIKFDYYEDIDGKNLLLISPPDLKQESWDKYLESMVNVGKELGSSNDFAWNEMEKVKRFEKILTNISQTAYNMLAEESDEYSKTNVKTLNGGWPMIKLSDILNNLTAGYAEFDNDTIVVTAGQYYLYRLNQLLRETAKKTQANYMIWKIVESFLPFTTDNLRNIYEKYTTLPTREAHCLSETTRKFYNGLQLYVNTHKKNTEIEQSLTLMTNLIKKEIGPSVEKMKVEIIGIDGPRIKKSLNIMQMINEVNMWRDHAFYNCLHKQSSLCSKEGFYTNPKHLEINFDVNKNSIDVPFVLLHSDWYRWNQPNYINYARLGSIIADVLIEASSHKKTNSGHHKQSGVDVAYTSYLQLVKERGKEQRLPAINYSINQLFWIHSRSSYCSSTNDSYKFDEVINSTLFNKDFNC